MINAMMKNIIYLLALLILNSCNLPEIKELNNESKRELDLIVNELKLEQFEYSFRSKITDGISKKTFYVNLYNIDDSTDFKSYNERIISIFEKSNFDFKDISYIGITYFRKYYASDIYVYYDIDPRTKNIIKEGTK
jgi:hypothetical protein